MFNNSFDAQRIPDHVLHDAVHTVLGNQKLEKIKNGYNFRCPICGDSKTNPLKKRGYILYDNMKWVYCCHNECGTMSFLNFLKQFDPNTYKKVIFYAFSHEKEVKLKPVETKEFEKQEIYKFKDGELVDIYNNHPTAQKALNYCISRKIPKKVYSNWFVCINDNKFLDRKEDGKLILNEKGYPKGNEYGDRLIIPYYTLGGKWLQFDARTLINSTLRYKNLEDIDRELYNIDFLDVSKPFFLLEGSINSTFIKNSVAFGGTKHLKQYLEKYPFLLKNKEKGTVIWDNDEAGYNEMEYTVKLGFNWFNWAGINPSEKYIFKDDGNYRIINDINDFVLYTDYAQTDEDGFLKYKSLQRFIKYPGSEGFEGLVETISIHNNRDKIKKEKFKASFINVKKELI